MALPETAGDPFARLNAEQRQAVDTVARPVLVMAPVGTGKTQVLTLRAARALEQGRDPRSLLCLSFTNKAAREMRERLATFFGKAAGAITTQTFHGLCASILRTAAPALGLDGDFLIYDEEDSSELMGRVWRRYGLAVEPREADRFTYLLLNAAEKARLARYDEARPRAGRQIYEQLVQESGLDSAAAALHCDFPAVLRDYVHELRENHALDFADLIVGVNRLWDESPALLEVWRGRFGWVQVDEVQDTSRAEYRVLSRLAEAHGQLSFFGDVDQTIYEWRGSAPFEVLEDYRARFAPLEIQLVRNYRSTGAILAACEAVVRECPNAVTGSIVAQVAERGEPVVVQRAANPRAEAEWIATRIRELHRRHGLAWSDIAVLCRTNFTARDLSRAFEAAGLPHVQVEQMRFFLRAEVKTAMAYLRLLDSTHDGNSLMRFLKTPPKRIGEAALEALRGAPRAAGLKLGDLLEPSCYAAGEPFAPLLEAWAEDRVVVFDTETTGLDVGADEIVELAAVRCGAAGITARFHAFLQSGLPVGESERIHGWSDEFLRANGREPAKVLTEFAGFCDGALLAGHNSGGYDLPALEAACARHGVSPPALAPAFDTLDLARRFHRLPRYRLGDLATALGLPPRPQHKAMDDVETTADLLARLVETLAAGAAERRRAVTEFAPRFEPLARQLAGWREAARRLCPAELLAQVLTESGLEEHFGREDDGPARLARLEELRQIVARNDNPLWPPAEALRQALQLTALGNDVERQAAAGDRVLILTVHQAKGLEFDTVFVANATDNEFPTWRSRREGRLAEEHRLFYVALSRARRRLLISYPDVNSYGRRQDPSRFLRFLE